MSSPRRNPSRTASSGTAQSAAASAGTSAATGAAPSRGRAAYLAAWRWRREVEKELRPLELTFTQWLVLDATAAAIAERKDDAAVSQKAVADACELDVMTVSQVMRTLSARGLVDRGPSASGPAYRILMTSSGQRALQKAAARVAAATDRSLEAEAAD